MGIRTWYDEETDEDRYIVDGWDVGRFMEWYGPSDEPSSFRKIKGLGTIQVFYAENVDNCGEGWYFWECEPGYMPTSIPDGPHDSIAEAIRYAKEEV